jgi:hypothetical protein
LKAPTLAATTGLFNQQLRAALCDKSHELCRVVEQNALAGSSTWMSGYRATQASWHGAALRLRLNTALEGAQPHMLCPGCHAALTSSAWMHHCIGCPRIDGNNASSRHAAVKHALKDVLRYARQSFDDNEPRIGSITCPGCRDSVHEDEWPTHAATCQLLTPALLIRGVRRSGPDVAYCIAAPMRNGPAALATHGHAEKVFADVTVVSTAAPTYVRTPIRQIFEAKKAEKTRKYGAATAAKDARLAVLAATASGHLGPDFVAEVRRITSGRGAKIAPCLAAISAAIMAGSSAALINAEKAVGLSPQLPRRRDCSTSALVLAPSLRQDALPAHLSARLLFDHAAAATSLFAETSARLHAAAARITLEVEAPRISHHPPHMPRYERRSQCERPSTSTAQVRSLVHDGRTAAALRAHFDTWLGDAHGLFNAFADRKSSLATSASLLQQARSFNQECFDRCSASTHEMARFFVDHRRHIQKAPVAPGPALQWRHRPQPAPPADLPPPQPQREAAPSWWPTLLRFGRAPLV